MGRNVTLLGRGVGGRNVTPFSGEGGVTLHPFWTGRGRNVTGMGRDVTPLGRGVGEGGRNVTPPSGEGGVTLRPFWTGRGRNVTPRLDGNGA